MIIIGYVYRLCAPCVHVLTCPYVRTCMHMRKHNHAHASVQLYRNLHKKGDEANL